MLNKLVLAIALVLVSTGCMTVRDFDGGKLESQQVDRIKQAQSNPNKPEPTPDYVKVADSDGVIVEVFKTKPIKGRKGIVLDVWKVTATNKDSTPKCVRIDWKLMDFNFDTALPYEFVMKPTEQLKVGTMTQTIWSFSDTDAIALPPSGYVHNINVRDADFDDKTKQLTCDMLDSQIDVL